jgi:putative molybdopterin biosynthesis protein
MNPTSTHQQQQFLTILDRDTALARFCALLDLSALPAETIPLAACGGRVLAEDVVSAINVPGFDRANVDGFAVRATDTFGASEDRPVQLHLLAGEVLPGDHPRQVVGPGQALAIATGGMLPRGADCVVMIEHTHAEPGLLRLTRPATPGANLTFAGTDISCGETVLRQGHRLTAREASVLAALGLAQVRVVGRPRVAILSTGGELVAPGRPLVPGQVYDSNAPMLAEMVREAGGEPVLLGIVPDDRGALVQALRGCLGYDAILLSGGTSKGAGDVSYQAVAELGQPGIVAHGIALKPGKPLCLAVVHRPGARPLPVVILPGFPTSAAFTFRDFVAPIVRRWAGHADHAVDAVDAVNAVDANNRVDTLIAVLPQRLNSERGRTEYTLVNLVQPVNAGPLVAYPLGKGSGSVSAFCQADGFITIARDREYLEAGETVTVQLLGPIRLAELIVIGSQCVGLDYLLGLLARRGVPVKMIAVGSLGGLDAVRRGECDLAGIHLPPSLLPTDDPQVVLVPGYTRMQGLAYRADDRRFVGRPVAVALREALGDPECVMINRNRGSGTRLLIDRLVQPHRPTGYYTEARTHHAVAAAIAQGRADWGVTIEPVARGQGLGFTPIEQENFDFAIATARRSRPAVQAFLALLADPQVHAELARLGFARRATPLAVADDPASGATPPAASEPDR